MPRFAQRIIMPPMDTFHRSFNALNVLRDGDDISDAKLSAGIRNAPAKRNACRSISLKSPLLLSH
jgi:hypothetical protein